MGKCRGIWKKFTPSSEELPSWLPDMERDEANKESIELLKIIKENEALKTFAACPKGLRRISEVTNTGGYRL